MTIPITSSTSITSAVWEGSLPIQFMPDPLEAKKFEIPQEMLYMVQASRCSYLPLVAEDKLSGILTKLSRDYNQFNVWYEYNGIPLKWHYPIGLLYDIHVLQERASFGNNDHPTLPWIITVHTENFPLDKLNRITTTSTCQDYYMSMLKEADYLRNGSTKKIMNMSKSDQIQLWEGVMQNNYNMFWDMNQGLIANDGQFRHLPIRIYLPERAPVVQDPIPPMDEEGEPLTLGQALNISLPDIFPLKAEAGFIVVTHGITLDLEMNLAWVYQNMAYPDNFLHFVVVQKK